MATFTLTPDFVFEPELTFNVVQTRFENNVTQRRVRTPAITRKFNLVFLNRTKADYEYTRDFLTTAVGPYTAFDFVNPIDNVTYSVCFVGTTFKVAWKRYSSYNFEFSVEENV